MQDAAILFPDTYGYASCAADPSHRYILPALQKSLAARMPLHARLFDIGAGNGYVAGQLAASGYMVDGIEPARDGVAIAREHFPSANIRVGSVYDDGPQIGRIYDAVYALEVIEHLYLPRKLVAFARAALKPGGLLILSTPYHGYLKNLALAFTGKLDHHFRALSDHGHIKFWSAATLSALVAEQGFEVLEVKRVGRIPPFAKSMILTARAPQ